MAIHARFGSGRGPAKSLGLIALLNAVAAFPAYGAITTTGDVNPDPNTTTSLTDLTIGLSLPGTMTVTEGSDVVSRNSVVAGSATASTSAVSITGAGSTWTNDATLHVANAGSATLEIRNGAAVSNTTGTVGGNSVAAIGTVTVADATWSNTSTLTVSRGTLNIDAGGSVTSVGTSNVFATGTVDIDGVGASWSNAGNLRLAGQTDIAGGGKLAVTIGGVEFGRSGSSGAATVSGTNSRFEMTSLVLGSAGAGLLEIETGGTATTTSTTTIGRDSGSSGTLTLGGGTFVAGNTVTLAQNTGSLGTVNVTGGVMDMAGKAISFGAGTANFNFTGGRLQHASSFGSSLVQTGGTLAAGFSAADTTHTMTITGDYTLGAAGTLEVELAGLTNFDLYTIGEDAVLAGLLDVSLLGGFAPEEGQFFDVLTADTIDATLLTLAQPGSYSYEVINGTGTQTLRVTVIPEPATFALIAMGLGCIASRRRGGVLAGR